MAKRRKKTISGKRGILFALMIILLIIALLAAAYYYWFIYKGKTWDDLLAMLNPPQTEGPSTPTGPGTIETGDLSIHFMELGNKYTGDSTLIKIGDTEVLIDAGSRQNSAASLVPYISQYCTDGVLEYVIATHAHRDHIAGFVGTTTAPGIFESFECKTIIDFPRTDATTSIYERYVEEIREPFRKLQQACFADPERTEEILKEACEMVLDGAQAELDKPMIRRGFHSKALMKDTYKMWIVAYLTPAVYELEYSISQDFNEALRQAWLLRYPGDSYELVKAEAVRKGFEWSWKKWLGI